MHIAVPTWDPKEARLLPLLATLALALATADTTPVETRTFDVKASKYAFEPSTIEVTEGDRVVLRLKSTDSVHGFSVKEFKTKVKIPKTGEEVTVEFVADKPGTFKFACSEYCGSGHSRMKGTLVVHPKGK